MASVEMELATVSQITVAISTESVEALALNLVKALTAAGSAHVQACVCVIKSIYV